MATIKDIIDINQRSVELLSDAGVRTLAQLLEAGATSSARMQLADQAHLDDKTIKYWVHQADLMRIDGLGPEFAHLLCKAEICTVPKLAYRSTDGLYAELLELNEREHIVGRIPSREELHNFITEAKRLPKLVQH